MPMLLQSPRPLHEALFHYAASFDALAVLSSFNQPGQQPEPGVIRNFLGTRIKPDVYPSVLTAMTGMIEGPPNPGNWHADIAEWAAALRAVDLAQETFRILELGCGWGCWMTNMGVAARSRGLKVELIGIEGEQSHLANARDTLQLNGFSEAQFRLVHGVAAPKPGVAIFPRTTGAAEWGGEARFFPDRKTLAAAQKSKEVQVLDCHTIADLSGDRPIDLLHIDIQGAEAAFVEGNMEHISRHVRRVLIGTHSRAIEGQLCKWFLSHGWQMEMERPAIVTISNGMPVVHIDGVQMWANVPHA